MIDYKEYLSPVKNDYEKLQEACSEAIFASEIKKELEEAHRRISSVLEQINLKVPIVPTTVIETLDYTKNALPKKLKPVEMPSLERLSLPNITVPDFLYCDKSFTDMVVDKLAEKLHEKINTIIINISTSEDAND